MAPGREWRPKPLTIILDNAPVQPGQASRGALAGRDHGLTGESLAKFTPDLQDIEREWKTLKAPPLVHETFKDWDNAKNTVDTQVAAINPARKTQLLASQ